MVVLIFFFFCLPLCCAQTGKGHEHAIFRNLVFEGGGIRGIAYAGALAELEQQRMLQNIKRVCGTSAGAITATLLAVGYTPSEIMAIISEVKFKKFADGRLGFLGGIPRIINRYGWYRGERLRKWIGGLIETKTGKSSMTFREVYEMSNEKNFKLLYITATNLSLQRLEVLSHETYPEMEIRDAVRISLSIPLFFRAMEIDKKGHPVHNKKDTSFVMLDGGITGNYPIFVFDDMKYTNRPNYPMAIHTRRPSPAEAGYGLRKQGQDEKKPYKNRETLGLRLDTDEQIQYDRHNAGLSPHLIKNFRDYIEALYVIGIENLNRQKLTKDDWDRTISISTLNIGPRIKKLSPKQIDALVESGKKGVEEYFNK